MGKPDLRRTLERYRALVMPKLLASVQDREPRRFLYDLIAGHLGQVGKALRPALCLATTEAFGGDIERAIPSAAALEMLHNAFLIHDDIEDGSEARRNQPAMYVAYGVALAVNAGDAMQALSVRLLRENLSLLGPELNGRILDEFDHMLMESLEGQALELGWVWDNDCQATETDYLRMVLKKTCWYSFIHPARMGGLVARGPRFDLERFNRFGYLLGAAFQIQDDVLNLSGDRSKYGKEIAGDLWEGKRTLILSHLVRRLDTDEANRLWTLLATTRPQRDPAEIDWLHRLVMSRGSLQYAREAAEALAAAAAREFEVAYGGAAESESKSFLRELTRYVVERDL